MNRGAMHCREMPKPFLIMRWVAENRGNREWRLLYLLGRVMGTGAGAAVGVDLAGAGQTTGGQSAVKFHSRLASCHA